MIIYTLWHQGDDNDPPRIADAVDELTVDNCGEMPPAYVEKLRDPLVRELVIDVPEHNIRALFEAPSVKARVVENP